MEPFLIRPEFLCERDRYTVEITEHWIEILLGYVEAEFDKMKSGSGLDSDDEQRRLQEQRFEVLVRRFQLHGSKKFFVKTVAKSKKSPVKAATNHTERAGIPDPVIGARWEIASRWDDWNRTNDMWMEMRLAEIVKLGYNFTTGSFKSLCITKLRLLYKRPSKRKHGAKNRLL